MRFAVRDDVFVSGYMTEWGSGSFAVAASKCWNKLAVEFIDMSVGTETFARHLFRAVFSAKARTFEFVLHLVRCVTMSG